MRNARNVLRSAVSRLLEWDSEATNVGFVDSSRDPTSDFRAGVSCYVVVDGRSLAVSRDELDWFTDALPSSRLARDVHSKLDRRNGHSVTVTITDDKNERAAIRHAAAHIRDDRPLSPSVFVMQELERLLEP